MLVTFELNGLMTAEYLVIHKGEGGGGVLPIMAYTRRDCSKGVTFSVFRYNKGS